jgi:hypothetical protein
MLQHQMTFPLDLMGDRTAVGPPGFLGKPAEVIDRHLHLAAALSQGLTIDPGDDTGDFLFSLH